MLRYKLLYAAILAGLVCFYVLYIDYLPLVLLICALLMPLFLKASLIWLHFTSDAHLESPTEVCSAGGSIPVTVVIENRSPFAFPKGTVQLRVTHGFEAGRETVKIHFPLQAKNSTRLSLQISADYCGIVNVEIVSLRMYDMLRLFHTNIRKSKKSLPLLFLPKPVELPLEASAPPVENPESDSYADKPGDDPSELFGIREYQPGDPVSRIHWKLSFRSDTLYLKEFGAPVDKNTLLLVEYCPPSRQEGENHEANALFTMLYSIALQLTAAQHPCTIAWYHSEKDEAERFSVTDESTLHEAFRALFQAVYVMGSEETAIRYTLGTEVFSSAILLTNLSETQMLGILERSVTANHRTMLLIGKSTAQSSEQTDIMTVSADSLRTDRIIV